MQPYKLKFKNIKIKYRILIIFQLMVIPIVTIFIILFLILYKAQETNREILLKNIVSITASYKIETSLLNLKEFRANYMLDGDKKWLTEFKEEINTFNHWYNRAFTVADLEDQKDILSEMSIEFNHYLKSHEDMMRLIDQGKKEVAVKLLLHKSMNHFNSIHSNCEKLISINIERITEAEEKIRNYSKSRLYLSYGIIIGFILIGIILVYIVAKSISDPIQEMVNASNKLLPLETDKTEIESLKESFELMIETIKENQQKMIISERRAAIGEIAAGISHELNNPIGVICGFAELLLKKNEITESDREFINDIYKEAQRCKNLLGQMLDFARNPSPQYMETNLNYLLNEIVRFFKSDKFKNIIIEIDSSKDLPSIMIDPVLMRQALFNIILNCCEAMNFVGIISIAISFEEPFAKIKISDNGPGIKDEIKDKIFTPFFTTKQKGVGLGLAICADIIEKHHGTIIAKNSKSGGAEFVITIPTAKNGD